MRDPAETSLSPPSAPATSSSVSSASASSASGTRAARSRARGRRARVRNRLLAGLLVIGLAVVAAGAPTLWTAAQQLRESHRLLSAGERGAQALALAHTLADERDALVVAGGDPEALAAALPQSTRSRSDREVTEMRGTVPRPVQRRLDTLPTARERALSGQSTPGDTYAAYTSVVDALDGLARDAHRSRPWRAADPTADALPDLARATSASAATRALLLAGLAGEGEQRELAGLVQRSHATEAAALADFAALASPAARESYDRAVTGPDVDAAEEYLQRFTAQPYLTAEDRELDEQAVGSALAARTDLQRGVLSALTAEQVAGLEQLRDDDVTGLQVRLGLVVGALLLALAAGVRSARSLTQPLAAVRLGSRRLAVDPAGQDPVTYTGRNDEFADVVASINALRAHAVELHRRESEASADTGGLLAERDQLREEQRELAARLAALHSAVHGMFAHHAERILALVSEQLAVLEALEEHETDPDSLATLFRLDHMAARVRRHGENLLLLAGAQPVVPSGDPLPLIDVLRAAVSEIERYELVETNPPPPPVRIDGAAARDTSHLLAELLDNAAGSSPEGARVRLTAWQAGGGLTVCVEDEGTGLSDARLAELNARLADAATLPAEPSGIGLYTVARRAVRHGLRVWLRHRPGGGTVAEVTVPAVLVTEGADPYAAAGTDTSEVPVFSAPHPAGPGAEAYAPGDPGVSQAAVAPGVGSPSELAADPAAEGEPGVPATPGGAAGVHGAFGVSDLPPASTGAERVPGGLVATGLAPAASGGLTSPAAPGSVADPVVPGEAAAPFAPGAEHTPPGGNVLSDLHAIGELRAVHAEDASRPADAYGETTAEHGLTADITAHAASPEAASSITASGLPLRTPAVPIQRTEGWDTGRAVARGTDPEELRRRLGGFQRGAREGHRDAAAHRQGEDSPS